MAKEKKEDIIKVNTHRHIDCGHCVLTTDKFLNNSGKPIIGSCEFSKHSFLLKENVLCFSFKQKK